ncbi:hypothetical protein [Treponema sp. R6D11]
MSKPHRGQSLRELYAHGRGECPICKRKNIKVLFEMEAGGQKFKICKTCKAAIKNGTKKLPVVESAAPPVEEKAEAPAETTTTEAVAEA